MRCPSCGRDADPANALCPYCHNALHIAPAPGGPYPGGPPAPGGPPPYQGGPAPYQGGGGPAPYPGGPSPYQGGQPPYPGGQAPYPGGQPPYPGSPGPYPGAPYPSAGQAPFAAGETWPSGNYQVLEPGPPPERSRSAFTWLVAGLAVLLVGGGAAVAAVKLGKHSHVPAAISSTLRPGPPSHGSSGTSGSGAADAKAEAQAIDQLLTDSSNTRLKLGPALSQVDGCTELGGAATTIKQVTGERTDELKRGQNLAVDRLTGGSDLRGALVQALTYSLQADQKFADWAQAVATAGCSGHAPHDDNYTAAQAASTSATTSKQQFVALWNPLAATYGLQSRSESTM